MIEMLQLLVAVAEELQTHLHTFRIEIEQLHGKLLNILAWLEPNDNFLGVSTSELVRAIDHVQTRVAVRARTAVIGLFQNNSSVTALRHKSN